jgi:hypothetical protein
MLIIHRCRHDQSPGVSPGGAIDAFGKLRAGNGAALEFVPPIATSSCCSPPSGGPPIVTNPVNWWGASRIALMLGAGDNSFAPGGAPESSHCIFCLAGVSYALEAPLPSVACRVITITIASWIFTVWLLLALTVDASARPRSPPYAA